MKNHAASFQAMTIRIRESDRANAARGSGAIALAVLALAILPYLLPLPRASSSAESGSPARGERPADVRFLLTPLPGRPIEPESSRGIDPRWRAAPDPEAEVRPSCVELMRPD